MRLLSNFSIARRKLLSRAMLLGGALSLPAARAVAGQGHAPPPLPDQPAGSGLPSPTHHTSLGMVGDVDHARNGFDPHALLTDWDTGKLVHDADGRRCREFELIAEDKEIEIAPGVFYPAWVYNGRVPGPTLRVTEGDRVRIRFVNYGSHPHSIHFHNIHTGRMDGAVGAGELLPGETFVYEFDALPFGCHLYHCHTVPFKRHLHKGLYGAFIIDPDPDRHPEHAAAARSRLLGTPENARWQEFVMVLNGFDTNFDDENEIYAANTIPFAYSRQPIAIDRSRPVRIYLVNVTEFDPINSFHIHGNFFDYYDHGTTLTPTLRTVDTIMQCQGQRGIVEMSFAEHEPGLYMFHAHQAELTELGWMSAFEVRA